MSDGDNGSICAACGLPERVERVEHTAHVAFTDAGRLLEEVRQYAEDSRRRDDNMLSAIGEIHKILAGLVARL